MKLDLSNKYKQQLAREKLEDLIKKEKWIEIRELRMKRSIDQNSLYWLWLTCLQVETGHDKNELHFLYRAKYLPKDQEGITNIIKEDVYQNIKKNIERFNYFPGIEIVIDIISRSTTALESDEFTAYLKEIRNHARVNFGVILLTLEDQNFKEFYKEYAYH